jgi:hypothetical protein
VLLGAAAALSGCDRAGRPAGAGLTPSEQAIGRMVRVNASQYQQAIEDIFGPTIVMEGRLKETEKRSHGLLAVGDAEVSYTSAGMEAAEEMAQQIAAQVVDESHRDALVVCRPANVKSPDDACAKQFFARTGRLLFRRRLEEPELASQVRIAHEGAEKNGNFYSGLAASLASMLISPEFLFRVEIGEPDPQHPGKYLLTPYSKASRLSALLWNSSPDDQLLTAAETGELDSARGIARQVDRMLASPKLEHGVRAFFSDMLEFDKFDTIGKDPAIYPRYTAGIAPQMREQALRMIVDVLLHQHADYRELFLTRETFLTPALAALTDIPVSDGVNNGEPDKWIRYTYSNGDPRAGFLALPAFTALNSHPGKSSPTLRGKALRQDLQCQVVPDPPAGVNFELFNSAQAATRSWIRSGLRWSILTAPAVGGIPRTGMPSTRAARWTV